MNYGDRKQVAVTLHGIAFEVEASRGARDEPWADDVELVSASVDGVVLEWKAAETLFDAWQGDIEWHAFQEAG